MSTAKEAPQPIPLPDDLKHLLAELKVPSDDPLRVLLAWHWQRVADGHDRLKDGTMALAAVFDNRLAAITDHLKSLDEVSDQLVGLNKMLAQKPSLLARQFEEELKGHVASAVAAADHLTAQLRQHAELGPKTYQRVNWIAWGAAFLTGFVVGIMLLPWTASLFFSRS